MFRGLLLIRLWLVVCFGMFGWCVDYCRGLCGWCLMFVVVCVRWVVVVVDDRVGCLCFLWLVAFEIELIGFVVICTFDWRV